MPVALRELTSVRFAWLTKLSWENGRDCVFGVFVHDPNHLLLRLFSLHDSNVCVRFAAVVFDDLVFSAAGAETTPG